MEMISPKISKEEELSETLRSFPVFYDKSHNGFKVKDAVKNAWDGVVTALEFMPTGNYFYFNSSVSFFILLIWLNQLVPGVPNVHPPYHLLLHT